MAESHGPFLLNRLTGWPQKALGPLEERRDPCGFCNSRQGYFVAKADYWDLAEVRYMRCPQCEMVQVDPMLNREITAKGCEAYYLREVRREGRKNLTKNRIRSFRKGVYFAWRLKRLGIKLQNVLEVGAGDGYFSRGVQLAFPEARYTCLDLVPEVLQQIRQTHGFNTLLGTPEELTSLSKNEKFDLIIARDIIEHVSLPAQVLENFAQSLISGGCLHIITPNGYEDIWTSYCHWKLKGESSEMLINHVNFFAPRELREKLESLGLKPLLWYMYDFNGTRWGRARKVSASQMSATSQKLSAEKTIQEAGRSTGPLEVKSSEVLDKWWVQPRHPWVTFLYCFWKEQRRFTLPADMGIGHEIFGLFQKS